MTLELTFSWIVLLGMGVVFPVLVSTFGLGQKRDKDSEGEKSQEIFLIRIGRLIFKKSPVCGALLYLFPIVWATFVLFKN
jgi:hypothetical protein